MPFSGVIKSTHTLSASVPATQGFAMMTITLAIMAGTYNLLRDNAHWAFIILCKQRPSGQ